MSRYAAETKVSVSKSKAEIEKTLDRYGAEQVLSGWSDKQALVGFTMQGRQVRFVAPLPAKSEFRQTATGQFRSLDAITNAWEKACRQRWRGLALVIKAKLEAVDSGIAEFEDEFLANIVMPNGRTVGEEAKPAIAAAYETGAVQPLLPHHSGG